jgi:hypothetical protein
MIEHWQEIVSGLREPPRERKTQEEKFLKTS